MKTFQVATALAAAAFAAWSLVRLHRGNRPRWLSVFGVLLGVLGTVTAIDPQLTTTAARWIGIGRGADLIVLLLAIAFVGSWFWYYQQVRELNASITKIVREMAIQDARRAAARDARSES